MNTKHKHYEYIVAFAEGKAVEYFDDRFTAWARVYNTSTFDFPRIKFRIKPEQKKTVGYRRYILEGITLRVAIVYEDNFYDASVEDGFIRWIDNEFQYETVEEV